MYIACASFRNVTRTHAVASKLSLVPLGKFLISQLGLVFIINESVNLRIRSSYVKVELLYSGVELDQRRLTCTPMHFVTSLHFRVERSHGTPMETVRWSEH